jgi:hypothetical protein
MVDPSSREDFSGGVVPNNQTTAPDKFLVRRNDILVCSFAVVLLRQSIIHYAPSVAIVKLATGRYCAISGIDRTYTAGTRWCLRITQTPESPHKT